MRRELSGEAFEWVPQAHRYNVRSARRRALDSFGQVSTLLNTPFALDTTHYTLDS